MHLFLPVNICQSCIHIIGGRCQKGTVSPQIMKRIKRTVSWYWAPKNYLSWKCVSKDAQLHFFLVKHPRHCFWQHEVWKGANSNTKFVHFAGQGKYALNPPFRSATFYTPNFYYQECGLVPLCRQPFDTTRTSHHALGPGCLWLCSESRDRGYGFSASVAWSHVSYVCRWNAKL